MAVCGQRKGLVKMNKKFLILLLAILWCPFITGAWDKDKPAATTSLRSSNPEMLENNSSIETALNREHEFSTGGTVTDQGHHKKGSARAYFQDAEPATRINGEAFNSEDLGSLWFDSNSSPDNQFFVLTATTPTWTPVSTEVIATMLASNRTFLGTLDVTGVFAALSNATVGGTLDVTGNIDPTSYETTNGGFLDEDDMTSDSATAVASQQSIKAFGDAISAIAVLDPTSYSFSTGVGQDSITFSNGLIVKFGSSSASPASAVPITYTDAFPNAVICGQVTGINTTTISSVPHLKAITTTQITPEANSAAWDGWHWIAIGR